MQTKLSYKIKKQRKKKRQYSGQEEQQQEHTSISQPTIVQKSSGGLLKKTLKHLTGSAIAATASTMVGLGPAAGVFLYALFSPTALAGNQLQKKSNQYKNKGSGNFQMQQNAVRQAPRPPIPPRPPREEDIFQQIPSETLNTITKQSQHSSQHRI